MQEFFAATFAYPTLIFTVLLGLSALYWILVIVGAIGIDSLDLDIDLEGATEGATEGVAEGVAEGAAEGGAHGAIKGIASGADAGEIGDAMEGGVFATLLNALNMRTAPMTVVLSIFFFFAWLLANMGRHYLIDGMGMGPVWLVGTGLLVGSLVGALPLTAIFVRPLGKILKVEKAVSRKDLLGKVVRIDTSRVDARFGRALADDGGAGLIVEVRCDGDNTLGRGSQALVVSYDEAREAYEVAPLDDIVPSEALAKK